MNRSHQARRLYRVVERDPPMLRDFQSNAERGRTPIRPLSAFANEQWAGVSCWTTETKAREKAALNPAMGAFIAVLDVPEGTRMHESRTGHVTVWATASALRSWMVAIVPVQSEENV